MLQEQRHHTVVVPEDFQPCRGLPQLAAAAKPHRGLPGWDISAGESPDGLLSAEWKHEQDRRGIQRSGTFAEGRRERLGLIENISFDLGQEITVPLSHSHPPRPMGAEARTSALGTRG